MNNKGQGFGFINIIFYSIVFVIFFALALAPFITIVMGVSNLSILGGFGSWAMSNLSLWFFLVFLLVVFVGFVYGWASE